MIPAMHQILQFSAKIPLRDILLLMLSHGADVTATFNGCPLRIRQDIPVNTNQHRDEKYHS